jgi:endoglycosylceramidase
MVRRMVGIVMVLALAGGAPACSPGGDRPTPVREALGDLLPLQTSPDRRIVDSAGRDVLLRGANVNSLGEYWQGVPALAPTLPVTDADWASMAAHGFSVVRLLVSWSRIEPERGVIDHRYLDRVDEHVRAADEHGIYTVIDMHQDAYSAFISTTDPAACPAGTGPAKGWDGAPAWAVITDGLSTCTPGERNASPAVNRAWNHFYDDTHGIRTRFVASWRAVAERFAGRPEVAGYDLLNEPEASRPAPELTPIYEDLMAELIGAVREAEAGAPFEHIVIVEPAIPAGNPANGIVIPDPARAGVPTTNVVASVHNYAESILSGITIEQMNEAIMAITTSLGVATWGGEYGFWDTSPETLAKVLRYAADEDRLALGGAWWQWRQSCGDPHAVRWSDGAVAAPTGDQVHLNRLGCPGNVDEGPTEAFLSVLGRAYPRATPGRITALESDPATGRFRVAAESPVAGGELIVWTPTTDGPEHRVAVTGLGRVTECPVPGGRLIFATVSAPGPYELRIGPAEDAERGHRERCA